VTSYRYPLPRHYRPRYPYKFRKGNSGPVVGLVLGGVLAAGGGTGAVAAHHHATVHQPPAAASAPVLTAAGPGETGFIAAVLADLGAPGDQANVASLEAWFPHEYPSWPPWAAWNPMSSTLYMAGATIYNTLPDGGHVWNYPTAAEGAEATALTLADGWYPLIASSLRSGIGLCGNPSLAGEFLTWSGGGYPEVC
jgi:hypothetical protein